MTDEYSEKTGLKDVNVGRDGKRRVDDKPDRRSDDRAACQAQIE